MKQSSTEPGNLRNGGRGNSDTNKRTERSRPQSSGGQSYLGSKEEPNQRKFHGGTRPTEATSGSRTTVQSSAG